MIILTHMRELCKYIKYSCNSFLLGKYPKGKPQSGYHFWKKKNELPVFALNLDICQGLNVKFHHFSQPLNLLPFLLLSYSFVSQTHFAN